jgi:fatty acid desaturase
MGGCERFQMSERPISRALPTPGEISGKFSGASDMIGIFQIVGVWAGIIFLILVTAWLDRLWLIPLVALLLAGLQHRFFTIYHESFHGCLTSNVELGHFLGKYFAAYPSLSRYDSARQRHLDHHSHAASANDPDRVSHCVNWREMAPLMFAIPFAALRSILDWAPFETELQRVLSERDNTPYPFAPREPVGIVAEALLIMAGLGALCWVIGANPLWALLYHTTLVLVMAPVAVLRQWAEHYIGDEKSVDPKYLYVRSNRLERFLFSPMNFNYHGAHHYYPWIPHFKLPALQAYLLERGVAINERSSYLQLLAGLPWKKN